MPRVLDRDAAQAEVEAIARTLPARYGQCTMCALADSDYQAHEVVVADSGAIVRLDRFAVGVGHVIVVYPLHVERVELLSRDAFVHLQVRSWQAARAIDRVVKPRRVWIATLGNPERIGSSMPHVHGHVIPVFARGEDARPARVLSWSSGVTVYDESEAAALAASLREAWES